VPSTVEKTCKYCPWAANYVLGEGRIVNGEVDWSRFCLECMLHDFDIVFL